MKKILFLLIIILIFLLPISISAYDPTTMPNNIYGISVINHSDLPDVSNLVNVSGGDWGYVTIVITEDNRNKEIWQKFMDDCRQLHLIPIIRVASKFDTEGDGARANSWNIPKIEDIDSWINFFNSLNWVIENRYIVISNEPNHAKEWGGKLNPSEYAIYLKTFAERLHNASPDYFVLNAGFDQDAPNSKNTMSEDKYIIEMQKEIPDILEFIDGWNSHSYPNPAFSGPKTGVGRRSIRGYEWELEYLRFLGVTEDLPIFITETGWTRGGNSEKVIGDSMKYAYENIWSKDKRIVAVTPFILNYQQEPFYDFSWKNKDGSFFPIYSEIQNINKIAGDPILKIIEEPNTEIKIPNIHPNIYAYIFSSKIINF